MLENLIKRNIKHFTTITSFLVILEDYIECLYEDREYTGLTLADIGRKYQIYYDRYGKRQKYYSSYVVRHAMEGHFYYEQNGRYLIRPELVNGLDIDVLIVYKNRILSGIEEGITNFDLLFESIDMVVLENNPENSKKFILELIESDEFKNFGQIFEILSYSILKIYFQAFGFILNRFSTSFSNDGGMDFISSTGIYQVTASPTTKKIEDDLSKLPGTLRVMVYTDCSESTLKKYLNSVDVTEIISLNDLKYHFLEWLYNRDKLKNRYLKNVIITIKDEISREK